MTDIVLKYEEFLEMKKSPIPTNKEDENNQEDEDKKVKIGYINDILFENRLLNECGKGLSEEESYLVNTSIINYNKKHNPTKTIFWGKIFGINKNYYIIQVENENSELEIKNLEVKNLFLC